MVKDPVNKAAEDYGIDGGFSHGLVTRLLFRLELCLFDKRNFSFVVSTVRADLNEPSARTSVAYCSGPHMQHVWLLEHQVLQVFVGQPAT